MKKRIGAVITAILLLGILIEAAGCKTATAVTTSDNISASTTNATTATTTTTAVTTTTNTTTISTTAPTDNTIMIMNAPGSIITNQQNDSSQVLLISIEINKGISDKHYYGAHDNTETNPGDPVFLVTGIVQNMHPVNKYVTLYALGYDEKGNQVADTMDCSAICGEILLQGGTGETGEFTMHLNYGANMKTLRIFANTYAIPPP